MLINRQFWFAPLFLLAVGCSTTSTSTSTSSSAGPIPTTNPPPPEASGPCGPTYTAAYGIMEMRQWGTPILRVMNAVDTADDTPEAKQLARRWVREAYDFPRLSVPKNQERAAQDFANDKALECLEAIQR